MTEMPHILVVDDDQRLRGLLNRYLSDNGFSVTEAADAGEARRRLGSIRFDLIVLDVMMPGETGLELTASLRKTDPVPILLLTAMGELDDRVAGLECGADDYLPKPFEPRELVARIQSILRRSMRPESTGPKADVYFGPYRFEFATDRLYRNTQPVRLTETETRLLRILALNAGNAVSRRNLRQPVADGTVERAVDVQVTRLRRKIEPEPAFPQYVQTVRGQGYVLMALS